MPDRNVQMPKHVGAAINAYNRDAITAVVSELKRRCDCTATCYVRTESERLGFLRRSKSTPWDRVEVCESFLSSLVSARPYDVEIVARSTQYEDRIGESYGRLMMDRRQTGRGFSPGCARHPRDRVVERAELTAILHALNEQLAFWEAEIVDHGVNLILDGTKEAAAIGRVYGVPWRFLTFARHGNMYYWSHDEFRENVALASRFDSLVNSPATRMVTAPYVAAATKMQMINDRARWTGAVTSIPKGMLGWLKAAVRGKDSNRRGPFLRTITGPIRRSRDYYRYRRLATASVDWLKRRQFVYFPLQKEPETSWLVTTPEFTCQHAAIIALATELPAGTILAVKENITAVGRRPTEFYDQLLDLKNVVLVPFDEPSLELQRDALMTSCLTGSAGFEAAVAGRPVLVFGRHVQQQFLDHVQVVRGFDQIGPFVRKVAQGEIDLRKAARDGARLLQAMVDTSFDMGKFVLEEGYNSAELSERAVGAVDVLLNGLDTTTGPGTVSHQRLSSESVRA